MIDEKITIQMLTALRARLEAQRASLMAEMSILLRNPTGVADHSSIIDDLEALLGRMAETTQKLSTLDTYFVVSPPQSQSESDTVESPGRDQTR